MCGVAGIINLSGRLDRQRLNDLATRMADRLQYRGPDDAGVWVDPTGYCAFSHRRLSVVDLSLGGHQPMIHAATGNAITFNGEIYNYQERRAALQGKGHSFCTASDTEVLLAGLVAEGEKGVDALDGMFAFGYFDAKTKMLTLARDAFGEKPLYYARTADWFAFASELHALTVLPHFDTAIEISSIATYLALQYVPAPLSIYKNANKLPPGHTLTLTPDGKITIERHFHFSALSQETSKRSLDDLADELEHIIGFTVKTRLIADVPLGAFLSGGVDSSTVVAVAMKQLKRPIKTFSIGFTEGDSEHIEARAVAEHLGAEHYEEILSPEAFDLRYHIPKVLDEPHADSSCMPTWMVSRFARQQVTVALSGDGGDELFGGYDRYQRMMRAIDSSHPSAAYEAYIQLFTVQALEKFIGPLPKDTAERLDRMRAPLDITDKPLLQRLRENDIENYLPGAVLAKVDRMSMQHSLEVRAPLLGRAVADFAARMAADDLCTIDHSKRVLKQLAARHMPREWLDRPKKGFAIPTTASWGGVKLAAELKTLLTGPECRLAAWIAPERLGRFIDYHMKTPMIWHMWPIFVLEKWLRSHPGTPA